MSDAVIGILAVLVGAVFCFRGYLAMRLVISLWGAFVGLSLGAAFVSAITGDGYFGTALGWAVAIILAVVFSVLAYLYYAVAVVLTMASVGFFVGTGVMAAVGVTWNWVIILVGVVVGVGLAILTLAMDLPAMLLVVVSALGGAIAIVAGVMLLAGKIRTVDFDTGTVTATADLQLWWYVMFVVLLVAGIFAQTRMRGQERSLDRW